MNKFKNYVWTAAGFVVLATVISGINTAPAIAALVKAALIRDADNPAMNPFSKELCVGFVACTDSGPLFTASVPIPSSFTVPATTSAGAPVKRLVIDFFSGNCDGTGRAAQVLLFGWPSGAATTADTGDNFSTNHFPLAVQQFDTGVGDGGAAFATAVHIMYAPGTIVSTTVNAITAGGSGCKMQLNGYFVTQ